MEDNRFTLLLETMQAVISSDAMMQKGALNMRAQRVFLVKVGDGFIANELKQCVFHCYFAVFMIKQMKIDLRNEDVFAQSFHKITMHIG